MRLFSENLVRKKWKYLRDQFAVELGKIPLSRSGDAGDSAPTSKWPHFQSLLFLKDIVRPRFSTGNLITAEDSEIPPTSSAEAEAPADDVEDSSQISEYTDTNSYQEEENEIVKEDTANYVCHSSSPTVQSIQGRKRKRSNETFNNALLNLEKQKVQYLQEKSSRQRDIDDEDLFFFKSLLPHVRQIPNSKKLSFRNSIQKIVEQFAYQQQSFTFCNNQQSFNTSSSENTFQSFPSSSPLSTRSENTTHSFLSNSNACFPQSTENSNYTTFATNETVLNYTSL